MIKCEPETPPIEELKEIEARLEDEIIALGNEIESKEQDVLDLREQLFATRTLIGVCPWCGEDACRKEDGACLIEES